MPAVADASPYEALLVVSFGGPEGPDDVMPFLENVTRGRGVPRERLEAVAEHYLLRDGRSPINDQNRALVAALEADFADHNLPVRIYWGNRNWDPYLADAMAQMRTDGVHRAACFVTSAYASYSGCRQYREDLYDAAQASESLTQIRLDKLRHYFNHPGFIEPFIDATASAVAELPEAVRPHAHIVFVTHSIPSTMSATSGPTGDAYVRQNASAAAAVAAGVAARTGLTRQWDLVFCSRSGSPRTPWLEPDVDDRLGQLASDGVTGVVVVPIGFVSDHMEVLYDLDTQAADVADKVGLTMTRASTPGTDPRFVGMVRELLLERATRERGLGPGGDDSVGVGPVEAGPVGVESVGSSSRAAAWDVCAVTCCPNPAGPRPALCEAPANRHPATR